MKSDYSIINIIAKNCAEKIVEAILSMSEFYAGVPGLVTVFNRDIFNALTPASESMLEVEYGPEFVAGWKQKMEMSGGEL